MNIFRNHDIIFINIKSYLDESLCSMKYLISNVYTFILIKKIVSLDDIGRNVIDKCQTSK